MSAKIKYGLSAAVLALIAAGASAPQIAASINIKPGHDYYFYVRSVNTVGKSAFVEAVGQPSDDASGYLDFFKGEIGKTHLAQELWTQIDNGQLAPDLTEIRTSITDVSNEITQTVNKKLEDQSAAIQQIQKVQVDTNNNLNSMWAVKLQQMQDGRLYIAGIGAGIENTPDGMQSQVLLAADRIAMINPANGNTKPMFVGQGDQIFMNEVFLKRLTAPTITSGGNPPAFSLTSDGRLTAKNADISGSVNANSGTLNNVTINQNCTIKGKPASGRAVLSQEQDGIKSHTHSASASSTDLGTKTTSSFDYGTKSTNNTGAHTHSISGTANSAGAHQHKSSGAFGGTNTSIFPNGYTAISNPSAGIMSTTSGSGQTRNAGKTSSDGAHTHSLSGTAAIAGAHAHTVGIGAHTHSVAIGSHGHTITVNAAGNAENTVKNIAFNYIVRLA